jgi:ribosomal protein S18 acetylase RimI-like enzyme
VASSFAKVATSDGKEIRRARADDAVAVAQLLHDFNTEYEDFTPGVPALTRRVTELLEKEEIVVLLAGAPPLGFALFRIRPSLWSTATDVYLEELYVAPAHRGQGIGRRLLNAAMEAARKSGADHFELTTGETDTEARALYESTGMTNRESSPDGPRMLYYELDL